MAHCYSVGVTIGGQKHEICTTDVPGNESLKTDIESGKVRSPTKKEVDRAIQHFINTGQNKKKHLRIEIE